MADSIDENDNDKSLQKLGLGKRLASERIRAGVIEVVKLKSELNTLKDITEYTQTEMKDLQEFCADVFGTEDIECLNKEERIQVKKFIQNLIEGSEVDEIN